MRPFLAYATNSASTLNARLRALILISRCCYTARHGIGVLCVAARHKIYTVCDNAASDIAATAAENFNRSALLALCAGDLYSQNKGIAKFQSLQNFTLRTAAQKNYEIKDGMFKTKTQKRAMCEKDKI
ncbi:hypothetical protein [uncultured Campylobacter sp.]|uniref:hypothetical protein n=1 Tax=uncultured Campylobacter sp. TaxID=218934 RepID=UPI0026044E49|nr:hypothetical protein [uncultured Campylobacter sp.]